MLAIYKKELHSYFTSIAGWLFIAFMLLFVGIFHYLYNISSGILNFSYVYSDLALFFVFLVPMLTMRIMAEENKQKTDQLLLTAPVTITQVILGKYFAILTVLAVPVLFTCLYPVVLSIYGTINFAWSYVAVLGFFLLGAAYMAIGMYISTITESQAVAAVATFVVVLATLLMSVFISYLPTDNQTAWAVFAVLFLILSVIVYIMMKNVTVFIGFLIVSEGVLAALYKFVPSFYDGLVANVFGWFCLISQYDDFTYGILDLSVVCYYLSICVFFVFLTIQAVKKRRWS